jgi:hypothetical protein
MPFDLAASIAAGSTTPTLIDPSLSTGRVRHQSAIFTCATDAQGTYTAPILLPRGARVLFAYINASATLGASATVAIGIAGATTKYRGASTYTSADTFTMLAPNAVVMAELAAPEQIIVTIGAAALPASGRFVIGFFYALD